MMFALIAKLAFFLDEIFSLSTILSRTLCLSEPIEKSLLRVSRSLSFHQLLYNAAVQRFFDKWNDNGKKPIYQPLEAR